MIALVILTKNLVPLIFAEFFLFSVYCLVGSNWKGLRNFFWREKIWNDSFQALKEDGTKNK